MGGQDEKPAAHLSAAQLLDSFSDFSKWLSKDLPPGPDKQLALSKLVEARDAAVRAASPETVAEAARKGFYGESAKRDALKAAGASARSDS